MDTFEYSILCRKCASAVYSIMTERGVRVHLFRGRT